MDVYLIAVHGLAGVGIVALVNLVRMWRRQRARGLPAGAKPQGVTITYDGRVYDLTDTLTRLPDVKGRPVEWIVYGPPDLAMASLPQIEIEGMPRFTGVRLGVFRDPDGMFRFEERPADAAG